MAKQSIRQWAHAQTMFAEDLDARLSQRMAAMLGQAVRAPSGKVTVAFTESAAREGAYRFLENRRAQLATVGTSIYAATAAACRFYEWVYAVVDGSSLALADKEHAKGFGRVGTDQCGARGLKVMSVLAYSPEGVCLGVLFQVYWARPAKRKRRKNREQLPASEKETHHWNACIEGARGLLEKHAAGTKAWFQLDREADAWSILEEVDNGQDWFTVRGQHNRRVRLADGSKAYLRPYLAAQPVKHRYFLEVTAGPKRTARTACIHVRACAVTLDLKDRRTKRHMTKTVNVVLAEEVGTTPTGEKPISWMLLTNRSIDTAEDLRRVVDGYARRWAIEEFHRTWKSGGCNVEKMQLRSFEAAAKWATMLAAVATRIEHLKQLARKEPERPADEALTPVELEALVLLRFGKKAQQAVPAGTRMTISQAVRWIADLGGYTGKSSGGPPGSIVIGRGFDKLQAAAQVLEALAAEK